MIGITAFGGLARAAVELVALHDDQQ